jgi:ankyrin repeat protein
MVACAAWSESVARVLLQHPKLDVDAKDAKYYTVLMRAVNKDHAGIAEALLGHGASVKPDERVETSALIEACVRGGKPGLVRRILDRGREEAGVDFRGHHSCTALARACQCNALDIAHMLLQAGAAVDALNAVGWTPLMFAASCEGSAEIARVLLERGADPSLHGPITSPLMLACECSAPELGAVCQALIRASADVNAQSSDGATPLQVAIDNNSKEAAKALLNGGARVHAASTHRQLTDYIYELKRDLEAMMQVFPHALESSRGSPGKKRKARRLNPSHSD